MAQIAICREAAAKAGRSVRFVVFGTQGELSYGLDRDVTIGPRISIKEILRGRSAFVDALGQCEVVLDIGEGDSFADIYGARRFVFQAVSKWMVIRRRIPLVLCPQTLGPFNRPASRWIAALLMRRARRVFVRDQPSAEVFRCLVPGGRVEQVSDVAFRLPYRTPAVDASPARVRIGLNVSGLLYSGGYAGSNQFGLRLDYRELMRRLLQIWTAADGVEVWLIAHVVSDAVPRDDDRIAIAELAAEFPVARVAPGFRSPVDAKSFIATMDFMVGARMHACIAACSAGVAVAPLAYSRKFIGLFRSLGYDTVVDMAALDGDEALAAVQAAYARRVALGAQAQAATRAAHRLLHDYEEQLAELFAVVDSSEVPHAEARAA
ncbi:polysaccharide pyruvyl transferase [Rubrivivax gelatinosus]|nr:polysaccharide pyruvyl transferase [Rubrivivax gelatinosus]